VSVHRGRPHTARAYFNRRRSAVDTGTIGAELEAARGELLRLPAWRWIRRRHMRAHLTELALLRIAYTNGGRDMLVARDKVLAGWQPPGVIVVPPNGRFS